MPDRGKVPICPETDAFASTTNPATWGEFGAAQANVGKDGTQGVGFVFTEADKLFGIDLDDCLTDGKPNELATSILETFPTYAEESPSGKGLHLIGRGSLNGHRGLNKKGAGVEVYGDGRYFTVTGKTGEHKEHTAIKNCQPALDALIEELDPPKPAPPTYTTSRLAAALAEDTEDRARAYIAKMPEAISGDGGHDKTFMVALTLVKGFALPEATALKLLQEYNESCVPSWSDKDLRHKIESAVKAEAETGYLLTKTHTTSVIPPPVDLAEAPLSVVDLIKRVYVGKRFSTGFDHLNELLKGGLAPGFFFVVGGEPGIGKTTLLVQMGNALTRAGVLVWFWATDEPPEGLARRIGQLEGEDQDELGPNHPLVLDRLTAALSNGPWFLPDRIKTVAQATEYILAHTPEGKRSALLLDSLQTQSGISATEKDSPRIAITSLMQELNEAKKQGLIVLATSELARGGYASRDPSQRTRGLASFAESRAIEYLADIVTQMGNGGEDLVLFEVLKNRLGFKKGHLSLHLDHPRARFQPVDEEVLTARVIEKKELAKQAKLTEQEDRILTILEKNPAGLSIDDLRDRASMQKATLLEVLARLYDSERVAKFKPVREPGQVGRPSERYRLDVVPPPEPPMPSIKEVK